MTIKQIDKPYIPAHTKLPELTLKALALGVVMAVVLGAANAYLGLKAGMTISATFPAAVIAIAAFRLPFFKGSVLEQNIARTAASVGEALVAGAIFTVPAFVMVRLNGQHLWTTFHYWETSFILLIGGVLGILFVIILRRTLVVDADLPFPESYACYEIVKAGQKGESGAGYVFGSMGIGVLIELLKNSTGFTIFRESVEVFIRFPRSVIHHISSTREAMGDIVHRGGIAFSTPLASPALMGVGYIIGPELAAINFSGGVIAWLVLIPLSLFLNPDLPRQLLIHGHPASMSEITYSIWYTQVRPIAVGAMLVGSLYTLYGLKDSLASAFKGAFSKPVVTTDSEGKDNRLEKDLNLRVILLSTVALVIPMFFLYYYFSDNLWGAVISAVVMLITGFLFAAVGGWLVGLVGGSNQPISGLTLSTLIIAALLMVAIGLTGLHGIAAVLAVAAVVCAATSMAGDMIQDLKVGHLLGGTPWKMEIAEIVSVAIVSFVLVFPMIILHEGNIAAGGIGIGDVQLPAPQAGLMAQLAKGIVGGQMPWGLVIVGMFFSIALIMVNAPAPMLIAVGMYLPFETTFAIFIGGIIKWVADEIMKAKKISKEGQERATNTGILVASGFIAGEALTGVFLAALVLSGIPSLTEWIAGVPEFAFVHTWGAWLSIIIFAIVAYGFIVVPMRVLKK